MNKEPTTQQGERKDEKQRNETSAPENNANKPSTKPKTTDWYIEAAPMHMEAEHMARAAKHAKARGLKGGGGTNTGGSATTGVGGPHRFQFPEGGPLK